MKLITSLAILVFVIEAPTHACSTFALIKDGEILVGNNDDWFSNIGYLVVKKRGVVRQVFLPSAKKKMEWTSKYGSVTLDYNFVGCPSGGMNEAGLVVDESWPGPCKYPASDERPAIDEIQWLQYQFDNCATVDEVLETDAKLRVVGYFGQSHYFVCDRTGKAATVEWIDGKRVVHILAGNNIPVLTNDNYGDALARLHKCVGFGGANPIGDLESPFDRFSRAARMTAEYANDKNAVAVDRGFEILGNVSMKELTAFSWIYDISHRTIYYKTAWSPKTKKVHLDRFDFSNKSPMLMIEMANDGSGDISGDFKPYSLEKNRNFVKQVVAKWREHHFAMHITDAEVELMIHHPETMRLAEESRDVKPDGSKTSPLPTSRPSDQ